jgi:hypothetical protein
MPDRHLTLVPYPAATYVKRRRTPGWRKPEGAISCTRGPVNTTRWGNPFQVGAEAPGGGEIRDHEDAVHAYRVWLRGRPDLLAAARDELAGQILMCWCAPGRTCHVQDVLIPLVNEGRLP